MRPHAVLINIGRGKTLDEDALVDGAPWLHLPVPGSALSLVSLRRQEECGRACQCGLRAARGMHPLALSWNGHLAETENARLAVLGDITAFRVWGTRWVLQS